MPRQNPVKIGARASALKFMFGKIGNFNAANGFAYGFDLTRHILMAAVALKCGVFMRIVGAIGKPQRMLKPKALIHPRAFGNQPVIKRRGFLHPAFGQGFIGKGHHKAALIVFSGFDTAPVGGGKFTKTGHIHGPDINRRLAVYHPFSQREANPAALTKAGHHAHSHPVVAHPGHRPDHRIAVRSKGKGAVDRIFNPHRAQRRYAFKAKLKPVGYTVKIRLQQLMAEIPRRAVHFPRRAFGLISTQQHALAFLTEIDVGFIINAAGQTGWMIGHHVNFFGQQIMVLHRLHRQVDALHMAHFARPKPAAIDDMFGIDHPARRGHIPAAIRALLRGCHRCVGEILRSVHPRRFGKGIGCPRRIKITVLIIPKRCMIVARINQRMPLGHFLGADKLLIKAHIPRLRAFAFKIIIPGFIGGKVKPARHMKTHRMARGFFDLFIKINGIALQAADVGIT